MRQNVRSAFLSSFRGEKSDRLCGKLKVVDLNAKPIYDALSYVWGCPDPIDTVILGQNKCTRVAENLRKALVALRLRKASRTLWIDAICIDQKNSQERGHQVRLMQAIYSQANTVRVWLDVDVDIKSQPFRIARQLDTTRRFRHSTDVRDYDPAFWKPMLQVLRDCYWERVWTKQEFWLASKILFHLPSGTLAADTVARFLRAVLGLQNIDYMFKLDLPPVILFEPLLSKFEVIQGATTVTDPGFEGQFSMKLIDLFMNTACFDTSNPRDRVYGFLGMARDCSATNFEADYGISTMQVYLAAFRHRLKHHQDLAFLCYSGRERDDCVPAWLPTPEKNPLGLPDKSAISYASKGLRSSDAIVSDSGTLAVRGIRCDSIACCTEEDLSTQSVSTMSKQLRKIYAKIGQVVPLGEEPLVKDSALGLFSFQSHEAFRFLGSQPSLPELEQYVLKLLHLVKMMGTDDWGVWHLWAAMVRGEELRIPRDLKAVTFGLNVILPGAVYIGSDKARLGLCHLHCPQTPPQLGDEIWVLFGCPMPMVLRPEKKGESKMFKVIGPAVILDLMQGEAVDAWKSGSDDTKFQGLTVEDVALI